MKRATAASTLAALITALIVSCGDDDQSPVGDGAAGEGGAAGEDGRAGESGSSNGAAGTAGQSGGNGGTDTGPRTSGAGGVSDGGAGGLPDGGAAGEPSAGGQPGMTPIFAEAYCNRIDACSEEWGVAIDPARCEEFIAYMGAPFSRDPGPPPQPVLGPLPPDRVASCTALLDELDCPELYFGFFVFEAACWGLDEGADCSRAACAPEFACAPADANGPSCRRCTSALDQSCESHGDCSADRSLLCDLQGAGGGEDLGTCVVATEGAQCDGACGPELACVDEQCVPPPGENEPCDNFIDCGRLVNTCQARSCVPLPGRDAECEGGCKGAFLCDGTCGDRPGLGQECSGGCRAPYQCVQGQCRDPFAVAELQVGEVCAGASCAGTQCAFLFGLCADSYCNPAANLCAAYIPDGNACPDGIGCNPATADCTTSESFPALTCIPYERQGAPCNDASPCRPGLLCQGRCEGGVYAGMPCLGPECEGGACNPTCVPDDQAPSLCTQ